MSPRDRARTYFEYVLATLRDWRSQPIGSAGLCALCGAPSAGLDLCSGCRTELPRIETACARCAVPLPMGAGSLCAQCLIKPPSFDSALCPYRYEAPLNGLIKKLKYHGQLAAGRLLGQLLAEAVRARAEPLPDVLIPVPLHATRLRARGFNQSHELALPIARAFKLPVQPQLVERRHATAPQSGLGAAKRRRNVRGAFAATATSPPNVVIVDDVMTTGCTVDELARVLRKAGAHSVRVWALARAR